MKIDNKSDFGLVNYLFVKKKINVEVFSLIIFNRNLTRIFIRRKEL